MNLGRGTVPSTPQMSGAAVYDNATFGAKMLRFGRIYWRSIVVCVMPIALLPLILVYKTRSARCGFVILLMGSYWATEAMPMAVTSLLPLALFPVFGVLDSATTCQCYVNDTIMMFVGGLIFAIAIEHSKLHERIALRSMIAFGCNHKRLLGGLLCVTTFLSMWISNTACTSMMVPIVFAVLFELEKEGLGKVFESNADDPDEFPEPTQVTKAYLLGTAYASTFGGTATIIGTGANLAFKGIFEDSFPDSPGIDFGQWMIWALPQTVINVALTWFYMLFFYMGWLRPNSVDARNAEIGPEGMRVAKRIIREKYSSLGKMNFHQIAVGILFLLCIFLMFFRSPGFISGWADRLPVDVEIKESTSLMLVAILLFVIPKDLAFIHAFSKNATIRPRKPSDALVSWKVVEEKVPWSLMFIFGGGFAISKGSLESGLSQKIGDSMEELFGLPPFALLIVVCILMSVVTEFTSNIGVANIILPIIAEMSVRAKIHPLYFMIPATLVVSHAFRFPTGTPPNAIVLAAGHIRIKSLVIGGCGVATYGPIVVILLFITWGRFIYKTDVYPDWADSYKKIN
ncbi:protein I'm not dead yet-like [Trichogramma pretiosum]|uniref:protein I'm not dead yet-like n=1 Tax=Trichogramma pretiosum TaxID=7493 RepID=UPI0006C96284|nr:protein I'm not dead yet-like [Trichogramma pretiosum]